MLEFLFILFGLMVLFLLVVLVSIYRDYIINKKLGKKRKKRRINRQEAKELRDRLNNMGKPPWVRNYNKLTGNKKKKK